MNIPFVSIIIPTYNDWQRLQQCLNSLSIQSYNPSAFEVIVVNNQPSNTPPIDLHVAGNCIIIDEQQPGSYAARNKGLSMAKGSIIGFTDSDCIVDIDWIKNAVNLLTSTPGIHRIGGLIKVFSESAKPTKIELYDMMYAFPQQSYVEKAGIAVTANMFSRKLVFDSIGNFNNNAISGGDFDWAYRAKEKGFKIVYASNVIVNHPARNSVRELLKKANRVGKGQLLYQNSNKSLLNKVRYLLFIVRPKTWEMKAIFKNGKHLSLPDKLYLVLIRHLVLWTKDFSKLFAQKQKSKLA